MSDTYSARDLYSKLARGTLSKEAALCFLQQTMKPSNFDSNWHVDDLHREHQKTLKMYEKYLNNREDGAPRLLFPHIDAVKWFFLQVCPTKMVDGVWLSNVEASGAPADVIRILKKTYDDETGNGERINSHDAIFKDLFESVFDDFRLDIKDDYIKETLIADESFITGAIQLALALCTDEMFPELLGYNMGYEQLPFHMLVTCKELEEIGIDPYYFTLHVTVDNFHTGHAAMAIKSVKLYMEHVEESQKQSVWERIYKGFLLSSVGIDTESMMKAYTIKMHLERILQSKCPDSAEIHGRVNVSHNGAMVSLSTMMRDCKMHSLVDVLLQNHLIELGDENCTFWKALQEGGCMFKTFDLDEMDVIRRFIFTDNDEVSVEFDQYIPNVLKRYASRHHKVMLTHPDTNECKSLADWSLGEWKDLEKCLSDEQVLQKTIRSFESGKMKSVSFLVKEPCLHWLKDRGRSAPYDPL